MKKINFILTTLVVLFSTMLAKADSELPSFNNYNPLYDSSEIKLIIIDSQNNRDSASLVFHQYSSIGIDTAYGEVNLVGTPYNDPEVRVVLKQKAPYKSIQRHYDSTGYYPTYLYFQDSLKWIRASSNNYDPINYGDEETELKIDNRPFSYPSYVYPVFKFKASNFPVSIILQVKGQILHEFTLWDTDFIKDSLFIQSKFSDSYTIPEIMIDTVFVINSQEELGEMNLIAIFFSRIVSVQEENSNSGIPFYPNPVDGLLNLNLKNLEQIEIFDLQGNKTYSTIAKELSFSIDVSTYTQGTYLLRIGNKTYKFVKR